MQTKAYIAANLITETACLSIIEGIQCHAIACFKINLVGEETVYIHIVAVFHLAHPIWLVARNGLKIEPEIHYIIRPTDVWHF